MGNKSVWLGLGVFLAVTLAGFFLVRRPQVKTLPKATPSPATKNEENSQGKAEEAKEIIVQGNEYSFLPLKIILNKGEAVRLVFRNTGTSPHNLTINELGIETKTIGPGKSDEIEFTPEKEGTFDFYCSFGNHKSLGMEGTLEVK